MEEAREILKKIYGIDVGISLYDDSYLPLFIRGGYDFYSARIYNAEYVLMEKKGEVEPCKNLIRDYSFMRDKKGEKAIIVTESINGNGIRQLIKNGVEFIVPGRHLFIPSLGVALGNMAEDRIVRDAVFSSVAQLVFLYLIYANREKSVSLTKGIIAESLGIYPSEMTAAIAELQARGIVKIRRKGQSHYVELADEPFVLFRRYLGSFKNPVSRRFIIGKRALKGAGDAVVSGTAALSRFTSLSPDMCIEYAVSGKAFRSLRAGNPQIERYEIDVVDDNEVILDVWHYNPLVLARDGVADPISLYLTTRNDKDERVRIASRKMLERNLGWSMD